MALSKEKLDALRIDRNISESRGRPWMLPVIVTVLVIVGGASGFYAWNKQSTSTPVVATAIVASPLLDNQSTILNASGYVVARRKATVSAKVTGKITEVLVEEGMQVESGQVLARLDDSIVQARLALAQSQLKAAKDRLTEIHVRLKQAERDLVRKHALEKDKLVSAAELDVANSELDAQRARLSANEAEVEVAKRTVSLRLQDLDDLVIRAPFAGIVVSKDAQPGEMISPVSAGGGFTRTGICTIVDMDSREIEVDVNEAYINRVYAGQPAEAELDAYSRWLIPSRVINIVPTADRQRATVRVRLAFEELDARILPDMGIKVSFKEKQQVEAIPGPQAIAVVPAAALHNDGTSYVWIVRDGRIERRAIRAGQQSNGVVEVLAGLAPGEQVITQAPDGLSQGQQVKIK